MTRGSKSFTRRSILKGTVGAGISVLIGGIELRLAAPAAAAVPVPQQIGCDTWLARQPSSAITMLPAPPVKVIVHHTAGSNTTDYSQARAYALAKGIQNHHMDTNGWIDSGQQFTISRGGYILEGRHRSIEALLGGTSHVQGAHCTGQNNVAIGIENEGTYQTEAPTEILYQRLVALIAYFCQQYNIPATEIYGHRDFVATNCPGDVLYAKLPQIRSEVAGLLSTAPARRAWPIVQLGQTGERVKTVQYLLKARGLAATVDGNFSVATEDLVKQFQAANSIASDGIVAAHTWQSLVMVIQSDATGDAVRAVQSQFATKGYVINVDGAFGPITVSSVKSFQNSRLIAADGVMNQETWSALVK